MIIFEVIISGVPVAIAGVTVLFMGRIARRADPVVPSGCGVSLRMRLMPLLRSLRAFCLAQDLKVQELGLQTK